MALVANGLAIGLLISIIVLVKVVRERRERRLAATIAEVRPAVLAALEADGNAAIRHFRGHRREVAEAIAIGLLPKLRGKDRDALAAILESGGVLDQAASGLGAWSAEGALETTVVELNDEAFGFDVTRCRYAEMYRSLGLEDLGALLSCNRDGALIEGFNSDVEFSRTQTILGGATHCDFRFTAPATPVDITAR